MGEDDKQADHRSVQATDRLTNRRQFLKLGGASAIGLTAGCLGGGGGDSTPRVETVIRTVEGEERTVVVRETPTPPDITFPSEIDWIIYTAPGGGFNAYSRAIAPAFQAELAPNGVERVKPDNVTAAGGIKALNDIYSAEPDGGTVGIWNHPGHIISQLTRSDIANYDIREMTHIGQVNASNIAMAVRSDLPIENYEEFVEYSQSNGPLKAGARASGSAAHRVSALLNGVDGANTSVVTGYGSSADYAAGVRRGDLDWMATNPNSLRELLLSTGDGKLVAMLAPEGVRMDNWPDVPTRLEMGYTPAIYPALALNRIVSGPPGIPEEKADLLFEKLDAALQSDDVQKWSEDAGRPIQNVEERSDLTQIVNDGFEIVNQYIELFEGDE